MSNKIYINNTYIIVNLFEDIANIKAGFSTEHFDKYNNNIELDKKIKYINDNYTEYFLDKELKYINCKTFTDKKDHLQISLDGLFLLLETWLHHASLNDSK